MLRKFTLQNLHRIGSWSPGPLGQERLLRHCLISLTLNFSFSKLVIIITTWNDPGTDVIADTISTIGSSTGGTAIDKNDGKLRNFYKELLFYKISKYCLKTNSFLQLGNGRSREKDGEVSKSVFVFTDKYKSKI